MQVQMYLVIYIAYAFLIILALAIWMLERERDAHAKVLEELTTAENWLACTDHDLEREREKNDHLQLEFDELLEEHKALQAVLRAEREDHTACRARLERERRTTRKILQAVDR